MLAWELYLQQETSDKSLELLHLVANECYQAGFFLAAARAFDVLEQLDPSPEYWQAKQGACAGTLQMVVAGKESADALRYHAQIATWDSCFDVACWFLTKTECETTLAGLQHICMLLPASQ